MSAPETTDDMHRRLWDAATATGLEFAALSWGGFNIIGDRQSIDEVRRLFNADALVDALRARLKAVCEQNAALRASIGVLGERIANG